VAIFINLRDLASRCCWCFPAKPWPARTKPPSSARNPGEPPTRKFGSPAKICQEQQQFLDWRTGQRELRSEEEEEEAGLLDLRRRTELKSRERIVAIKLVLAGEEGEPLNRRGGREGRKGEGIR